MEIGILTLNGFNEIDSLVAFHILNRVSRPDWHVALVSPEPSVTSMNGLTVSAELSMESLGDLDAVVVGSGTRSKEYVSDPRFLATLKLNSDRQLVGSQCSGALLLAELGLLDGLSACTDLKTRPILTDRGFKVLDQPFHAVGNVATAGGCLASQYIAAWVIFRLADESEARSALAYVAPVGEEETYIDRAMGHVMPVARLLTDV